MSTAKIDVMTLFTSSLHSTYTRKNYVIELKRYMKARLVEQPEDLLKLTQDDIISYIIQMEKDGMAYGSRRIAFAAIKHFYEMNDITFNWKKISRFLGEPKKTIEDRGYTVDEIKRMLEKGDERKRVTLLILASSGMRLGGLAGMKLKDLHKTDNAIYRMTVYAGTKSRYVTFCSMEATQAIDAYMEYRKRCGERISGESPLIRNQFDKTSQAESERARPVKQSTIQFFVTEMLYDSGLREKPLETTAYKRKEVMAVHGFRKFFSTELNGAYSNQNPLMVELLLGHDTGLVSIYNKPSDDVKESFYLGGMDRLTINDENRLRRENVTLKQKHDIVMDRLAEIEKHLDI